VPRRPRVVRPGTALAIGIVAVLMLAATAVIGTMTHQPLFDGLSHVFVYLCFGLVGVIVAWHQPRNLLDVVNAALEPAHLSVWTAPPAGGAGPRR
jgi:hypothetical protein